MPKHHRVLFCCFCSLDLRAVAAARAAAVLVQTESDTHSKWEGERERVVGRGQYGRRRCWASVLLFQTRLLALALLRLRPRLLLLLLPMPWDSLPRQHFNFQKDKVSARLYIVKKKKHIYKHAYIHKYVCMYCNPSLSLCPLFWCLSFALGQNVCI